MPHLHYNFDKATIKYTKTNKFVTVEMDLYGSLTVLLPDSGVAFDQKLSQACYRTKSGDLEALSLL